MCVCIRAVVVRTIADDTRLRTFDAEGLSGGEEAEEFLLTKYKKENPSAYAYMRKEGMGDEKIETD
jgi:hypothetical protein